MRKTNAANNPLTSTSLEFNPRILYATGSAHFFNDLVTTGMIPALVVLYKEAFQLNYTEATAIVLVSYLTSSVMQPLFGIWTDRKPKSWFISLGLFLSVSGLALTAIAPTYSWLLFFIALSGIGSGMFHPEASRAAHLAAGNRKGTAQAIFQVGGNAGQAFGPLMLPLFIISTGIDGLLWFLPVALFTLLLTVPLLRWLKVKVGEKGAKKVFAGKNYPGYATILLIIIVLRSWCQVGVVIFLPFYYNHLSLETSELLNFIFVGSGALGTFIGGVLSDRIGMKRLLVLSMMIATPFALLLPYVNGVLAVFVLLIFGFTVLSSFSITVVYMQQLLPKNIAMASGLTIGFGVGAGGIGAVFMGGLSDLFSVDLVFTILSLLPLLGGILAIFLPSREKLQKPALPN